MADEAETHGEADDAEARRPPRYAAGGYQCNWTGAPLGSPLMERDPEPESPWWP